jgi:nucleotidyltransferase/DNA polymerase involved in DNA repair
MILCVHLPRFELIVAAGRGAPVLLERPMALAPDPGGEQLIGEVSPAAEAFGVRPGMRLGEALARCQQLALVPPDPVRVADAWEAALVALENLGAAVESARAGMACFAVDGLLRLHGGLDGVLRQTRATLRASARLGVGPTRFLAVAAATRARPRRPEIVRSARELAAAPVSLLALREATVGLVAPLERLGILTLGELAELPRDTLADRFGRAGMLAHDLVCDRDLPLRPRRPGERLAETLELSEPGSGPQLERALGMLVDRLLARRERRGRTLRSVVVSARLVEGGTWRDRFVFRAAIADPVRVREALTARLALLPAPADVLRLEIDGFGPSHPEARALFDDDKAVRRERLREAVRQARAAAGPNAALRALLVDPDSRVPERRIMLAPFEA